MNSDDEDFNDIYGEESTAKDEVTTKPADATAAVAKKEEAPSNQEIKDSGSNTAATSSLDQLAALQALSSNFNQQQSNSNDQSTTSNSNNNDNQNKDNNSNTENKTSNDVSWEQLQQTMSQFQQQSQQQQQQQQQENVASLNNPVKADLSRDICKMFIGGLNWETTEDTLRDYFSKYGRVIDLKIMKDTNTGRSRGFGFLTFDSSSSVDEVVKTQHILDGKVIDPKRAIPREEQDKTGKIFVGGIGADVRPKEFEEFFAQWGTIIDAQLMLDKDTGRSRGFGFVTYDSPDAVDRVCQNKFIDFKGKKIEIKRAEPRHMQKQQQMHDGMANPAAMGNPMAQMYQNPMMGGFNPMFNPQAMAEYYQKMQEYYQQMQQQTGMDYTQMFQQQMAMMMPGYPTGGAMPTGSTSSDSATPNQGDDASGNVNGGVQTIGGEEKGKGSDKDGSDGGKSQMSLPRGPRGPSPPSESEVNERSSHGSSRGRDRDRHHRSNHRNGYRGGNGGYRGRGYHRRNNNGYHPYNR
ncbi:HRP1 (YOL123W) [Zygosaccharomyces parabailii]|uniref:BN860_12310g1_1 n=1 Tax=Zygosaccharomyces bailii (strain CLIB 213 / ATCC 58445 / CBS 680 / BCRC 21525 / NBRC 1098 / NCYC 1416 / NRRL Y-2227) TaxID=1333698 RepID=A0A8J2T481_ZYGB2|nr:HRP1 (YOL123W) [Zygosaccharomyces parabailii]CDF87693.1 BN860_12310g1_1 [Zygosaccharomyces bailii CLIB 213]